VSRYATPLIERGRRGDRIDFKGSQFEKEIILRSVRWYVASPISYRQLEEMMPEHGVCHPFITPKEVADLLKVTHQTASVLIRDFEQLNILQRAAEIERNQGYIFYRYRSLFMD
jgi:hypothetical protein